MRALTLWPEWAWAVAHLGKDVENRAWAPNGQTWHGVEGRLFAIHAGKHVGGKPGVRAYREGVAMVLDMAEVAGHAMHEVAPRMHQELAISTSAILAVVTIGEPTRSSPSPWAVPGRWHWPLLQVRTLAAPVPCRGAQGLWVIPRDVENAVREQLRLQGEGGRS
jgi:hypothetical protein